ncbi:hypothetical protein Tco_1255842 [Tanacetum coccineum]
MDNVRPRASYSPIKRSYYIKPAFRPKNLKQDVKTSRVKNMTTAGTRAVVNTGKGKMDNALKKSRWVWKPNGNYMDHVSKESRSFMLKKFEYAGPKGISNFFGDNLSHRIALGMERDCQHGLYKAGMGSSRVLSDFAEKYGSKNRVLAGFGIGGKAGERVYTSWVVTEREFVEECLSEVQMDACGATGGTESSTNRITRNHMVTDKPLFGKFVKNNVVKNGNEVLDDVGDIKKEKGFEDNKKNKWADWKELVFKGSGNANGYKSTAQLVVRE